MPERPDIVLELEGKKWPLYLADGVKSIDETWVEPSQFGVQFSRSAKKYGDDPLLTLAEWRDWTGGRGGKNSSDDETRFWDSLAWTLSPGMVLPPPQIHYTSGIRSENIFYPGNGTATTTTIWTPLFGNTRYLAAMFVPSADYTSARSQVIIRRVGTPGTLTMEICSDNTNKPGSVLKTVTKTTSDVDDWISMDLEFTFASTQALTNGTTYHIKVYGASTDKDENCWMVLCGLGTFSTTERGESSANNTDWTLSTTTRMYHRITDAEVTRRWVFQNYSTGLYATTIPTTGTSQVYLWNETTDVLEEKTSTGLTIVSDRPLVSGNLMYFPQGEATNIRRYTGSAWADDGTNMASKLRNYYDFQEGPQVIRVNNATTAKSISFANESTGADLTFGTAVKVGDASYPITNLIIHDGELRIIKEDSMWRYDYATLVFDDSNLKNTPSSRNGAAMASWNGMLYFSWQNTLMQSYGAAAGDIGQSWRGEGPGGSRSAAYCSCALAVSGWLFVGFDAGASGQSYVQVYNGTTWHEIYRAPVGKRIRDLWWQFVDGSRSRLFIDIGTDIVYLEFPKDVAGPRNDTTMPYHYEWTIEFSTFDDGSAKMPKYFKEVTMSTVNLNGPGIVIEMDYQYDNNIGKFGASSWIRAGTATFSPDHTIPLHLGDKRAIRMRLRGYTNAEVTPPILEGLALEGFTRQPSRRMWNIRIKTERSMAGRRSASALLAFLNEASEYAGDVYMYSKIPELANRHVLIRHPRVQRNIFDKIRKYWTGTMTLSIMDMT